MDVASEVVLGVATEEDTGEDTWVATHRATAVDTRVSSVVVAASVVDEVGMHVK